MNWIKRVADDERERDAVRDKQEELAARKAELVRLNGRRLFDELRATVTRDVETFRGELTGARARDVVVDPATDDGGFVVHKPAPAAVSLAVALGHEGGTMICGYQFVPGSGLPVREERVNVVFADGGGETLQMKDQASGQVFATADALSEFLLVPVFTGRRR